MNFQYLVEVNQNKGPVLETYPSQQWAKIAEQAEARGFHAVLYRRGVYGLDIRPTLTDETGWVFLHKADLALAPWEIFAEVDNRQDHPLETHFLGGA